MRLVVQKSVHHISKHANYFTFYIPLRFTFFYTMKNSLTLLLLLILCVAFLWQCTSPTNEGTSNTAKVAAKDSLSFCLLNYYEPLSNKKGGGIYEDFAAYIAEELDKTPKFVYLNSAYFGRPVRDGIKKGICDCQMGHPIEEDEPWLIPRKVRQSKPYTSVGYAMATADPNIQKLEDLAGKKVIIMSQSPPMTTVGKLKDVQLKFMLDEPKMMQELAKGDADAVIAWGAKLYNINKEKYNNKFKVTDTEFMWDVAMLTQAKDSTLMRQINEIIEKQPERYTEIASGYGL